VPKDDGTRIAVSVAPVSSAMNSKAKTGMSFALRRTVQLPRAQTILCSTPSTL
jgi:hypothetical protein